MAAVIRMSPRAPICRSGRSQPKDAVAVLEEIQDLGLCSRGSGADNIRNVTGTPTAGIDPLELIDTRPYAREWHFHILNERALYGLPRKFNVAFDGAGTIPGSGRHQRHRFPGRRGEGRIWYRAGNLVPAALGGITGHRDFARDTGVIVRPDEATRVADAIVRVFIEHGDRTNRNKARLKYVLDAWGFDKFLAAVEEKLGNPLTRASAGGDRAASGLRSRRAYRRARAETGRTALDRTCFPVGKITAQQMRGIAKIAQDFGDGDIRLTVWQNLLISGVRTENVATAEAAIAALGLTTRATAIRAGLIACTGNKGCRFSASDTKSHAEAIAQHCEDRVTLDSPVNIHLTGCHHSCAQHYIGDIGLIGARVAVSDEGDTVEGYHLLVGGGFGPDAALGREIFRDVKAEDAPQLVERMLKAYLAHRTSPDETFLTFTRRHELGCAQDNVQRREAA